MGHKMTSSGPAPAVGAWRCCSDVVSEFCVAHPGFTNSTLQEQCQVLQSTVNLAHSASAGKSLCRDTGEE